MLLPRVPLSSPVSHVAELGVSSPVFLEILPSPSAPSSPPLSVDTRALLRTTPCIVGPFAAAEVDVAAAYLDAGAISVVFLLPAERDARACAASLATIPAARLVLQLPYAADALSAAGVADLLPFVGAVWFVLPPDVAALPSDDALRELRKAVPAAALVLPAAGAFAVTASDVGRAHGAEFSIVGAAIIAATAEASAALGAAACQPLDLGPCIAACARSDRPDGLFTTVVVDDCGKALGLVYSNTASVCEAVRCRRGVYHSRSRFVVVRALRDFMHSLLPWYKIAIVRPFSSFGAGAEAVCGAKVIRAVRYRSWCASRWIATVTLFASQFGSWATLPPFAI